MFSIYQYAVKISFCLTIFTYIGCIESTYIFINRNYLIRRTHECNGLVSSAHACALINFCTTFEAEVVWHQFVKRCLYRILKTLYDAIRRSGNAVALIKLQYPVDYTFGSHKLIGLTPTAKTSIWPICLLTRNTICHRCFNIEPNLWKVSPMLLSKMVDVLQTTFEVHFLDRKGSYFDLNFD